MPLIMLPMQEVIYVANVREYSYIVPLLCGKCQRVFIHCAIIMLLMSESIHTLCHYYVANVREYSYIVPLLCGKCRRLFIQHLYVFDLLWRRVGCRSGGGSGGVLEWVCVGVVLGVLEWESWSESVWEWWCVIV